MSSWSKSLYVLSICLFGLFVSFSLGAEAPKTPGLVWEPLVFKKDFTEFQDRYLIQFKAVNKSPVPISIEQAVPSCTFCVDLGLTQTLIGTGQETILSAFVIPGVSDRKASGHIKVKTDEPHIYDLAYQISAPILYSLSQSSLMWGTTREQKFIELSVTPGLGANFIDATCDSSDFSVSINRLEDGKIQIGVTPMYPNKLRAALRLKFELSGGGKKTTQAFVALDLSEVAVACKDGTTSLKIAEEVSKGKESLEAE